LWKFPRRVAGGRPLVFESVILMAQATLVCPHCRTHLAAQVAPPPGTTLNCPCCRLAFVAPGQPPGYAPQVPQFQPSYLPPAPRPAADPIYTAYPASRFPPPSAKPAAGSGTSVVPVIAGVLAVSIMLVLAIGVISALAIFSPNRARLPVAQSPPAKASVKRPAAPQASSSAPVASLNTSSSAPAARPGQDLDSLIAAIRSTDHSFGQMYLPLSQLSFMEPVPQRREEVAGLLEPLLLVKNDSVRHAAMNAVKKWGTQRNVPTLLKMLDRPSSSDRWAAMEALGAISGSKQAAEAIARLMLDDSDRLTAKRALEEMGPIAEDAVWQHVGAQDDLLHGYACQVLGKVGTAKSLAKLRPLLSNPDIGRRVPIDIAVRDIEKRLGG
jgi:hypothetical protein